MSCNNIKNNIIKKFKRLKDDVISLFTTFGIRYMIMITIIQHIFKGCIFGGGASGFVGLPILFIFRELKLTASRMQILKSICIAPWSIKSIIGIISDSILIAGYKKQFYMLITVIISLFSLILIVICYPIDSISLTILFFFIFLSIAVLDLLSESSFASKAKIYPQLGVSLSSYVWFGIILGELFSLIITGYLVIYIPLNFIYLIPIIPFLCLLYPIYSNWLDEKIYFNNNIKEKIEEDEEGNKKIKNIEDDDDYIFNICGCANGILWTTDYKLNEINNNTRHITPVFGININRIKKERNVFIIALFIGILSIGINLLGLFKIDTFYLFICSILVSLLMIIMFIIFIDPVIAKVQIFIIIQNLFNLSLEGATFFFYTDDIKQFEKGPHFSTTFYIIVMGTIASIVSLIGIFTYNLFFINWRYRYVFMFNNIILVLSGILNIIFYLRWNLIIGISDYVFIIGSESIQILIQRYSYLPASIILLQLCPKNLESIFYALLAASSNLGSTLSSFQGAFLMEKLNITPSGMNNESSKFDNLWIASLISTVLPIIPLFFIRYLIPDATQTERLLDEENDDGIIIDKESIEMENLSSSDYSSSSISFSLDEDK